VSATLLTLPATDVGDISRGLRALADQIDAGDYGDGHFLAWVIDCGSGRVECGGLGKSPEAGAVGHLLFGIAQRKLEAVGL